LKKTKPFFCYEKLPLIEKTPIFLYAVFTSALIVIYNVCDSEFIVGSIIAYIVVSQLLTYLFLYTVLRNLAMYLPFLLISVLHLIIYLGFIKIHQVSDKHFNVPLSLLSTVLMLLLFQLLRFFSLKIQKREFLSIAKSGSDGLDLIENKKVSVIDFMIFAIYMGTFYGLIMAFTFNYFNL
jgi:hypothetical protein